MSSFYRIIDALKALGWKRTKDKDDENFSLRWTQSKTGKFGIDYETFRESKK